MFVKSSVLFLVFTLAVQANADRKSFHQPSKEIKEAIAAEATKKGYDLSTEEGRKGFQDYMKEQRGIKAKELGLDLSTEEGRKAFKEAVKAQLEAIAKENNIDINTPEGRKSLDQQLISSGQLSLLPMPRGPKEKGGRKPREEGSGEGDGGNSQARPPKSRESSAHQQKPPRPPRPPQQDSKTVPPANDAPQG